MTTSIETVISVYLHLTGNKTIANNAKKELEEMKARIDKLDKKSNGLPAFIEEALNSGDGVYRP